MKTIFRRPALVFFISLLSLPVLPSFAASPDQPKSVEERRIDASIRQEVERLRQKEEMLATREIELKTLALEVDKKIADMNKARIELAKLLESKKALETEQTRELGKVYEKMEPAKAAGLLTTLEKDLAISILDSMSPKKAGKVLNNMDQETAANLSTSYCKLGK